MIAKGYVHSNAKEIEQAENLGIAVPEDEFKIKDIMFDLNKVNAAYLNEDNDINIDINGFFVTLVYNKEVFNELKKRFK